ncbi:MAG: DUF3179 domain-containing protein [Saprospiraceae bacterium]|nr:DUF3179 domain-containing protein [Saprospiraceae bacterium]
MKNQIAYLSILAFLWLFASACSTVEENDEPGGGIGPTDPNSSDWLIPSNQVFDGGPGKDGIPSIDDPQFSNVDEIDFLLQNDLVIGVKVGSTIRAYPHPILDWHEIVNDEVSGMGLAITYCPLTGTAIGWKRDHIDGTRTTFGVAGLLYNTNLIPYDRATDSNWSQMLLKSVNGELIGEEIETYPLVEMPWSTWKTLFPDSEVLNLNTGFNRAYGNYPYGDYRTNNNLFISPVNPRDDRLPSKERGLGVIVDGAAKFYRFEHFGGGTVKVITDSFKGQELVVVGSQELNFMVAYQRRLNDGTMLEFTAVDGEGDVVMEDQEGNRWNIWGEAVSGNRQFERLQPTESYIGMWFAWGAFYPRPEIF